MQTCDTAINTDREEWILEPDKTLEHYQISMSIIAPLIISFWLDIYTFLFVENETEISYFNRHEYETYKANPQLLW